ncbi:MAG: hypothetical protein NVSMB12_22360 [Acidimicrobiales bacterium]
MGDDMAEVRAWLRAVIAWIGDTAVIRLPERPVEVVTDPDVAVDGVAEAEVGTVRLTIVAA